MTIESLQNIGYKIENAKIQSVDLSMADHGVLMLELELHGNGWSCVFGQFVLGKGYLGAKEFSGNKKSTEFLMRVMDIVGVDRFNQMVGKYVRVAIKGWGSPIKIIGNLIEDRWFDAGEFFSAPDDE